MFVPKDKDWTYAVQTLRNSGITIMGDRFYMQQKEGKRTPDGKKKVPRKLKADWVNEVNELLYSEVDGLDKLTVNALVELVDALKKLHKEYSNA